MRTSKLSVADDPPTVTSPYQRAIRAMNEQHPAFVKADRIQRHLSPRDQARFQGMTPADFLSLHDAGKSRPVARSRESRPGRRSRSAQASRDGPDEPEPPRGGRVCAYCGASLDGRRPNVRNCSPVHRVRASQVRTKAERELAGLTPETLTAKWAESLNGQLKDLPPTFAARVLADFAKQGIVRRLPDGSYGRTELGEFGELVES
jgi:hypothetical protein